MPAARPGRRRTTVPAGLARAGRRETEHARTTTTSEHSFAGGRLGPPRQTTNYARDFKWSRTHLLALPQRRQRAVAALACRDLEFHRLALAPADHLLGDDEALQQTLRGDQRGTFLESSPLGGGARCAANRTRSSILINSTSFACFTTDSVSGRRDRNNSTAGHGGMPAWPPCLAGVATFRKRSRACITSLLHNRPRWAGTAFAPCPDFRGSRWWFWSLEEGRARELMPAPHSSVAVRRRERQQRARPPGQRGINGGDPRQRGGDRLCRERPWRQRARRYGPHEGRTAEAGSLCPANEGLGRAKVTGRSTTVINAPATAGAPTVGRHSPFVT